VPVGGGSNPEDVGLCVVVKDGAKGAVLTGDLSRLSGPSVCRRPAAPLADSVVAALKSLEEGGDAFSA
jgi:hypothetical protein